MTNFFAGLWRLWQYLAGDDSEFSMENKAFNSISIITLLMLSVVLLLNVFINIQGVAYTVAALMVLQAVFYYFARYKKRFHISLILYAIFSYVALIVTYYQNSGVSGPIIVCFFITFHLLIAFTPNKLHIVWVLLHSIIVGSLLYIEYSHPYFIPYTYPSRQGRFFDIWSTFVVTILLTYSVTYYLRNKYQKERRKAEAHALMVDQQTKNLAEIAWMQSHMVRNHATTIMGLSQLFNENDPADPINGEVLEKIKEAAGNLDMSIREINARTKKQEYKQSGSLKPEKQAEKL